MAIRRTPVGGSVLTSKNTGITFSNALFASLLGHVGVALFLLTSNDSQIAESRAVDGGKAIAISVVSLSELHNQALEMPVTAGIPPQEISPSPETVEPNAVAEAEQSPSAEPDASRGPKATASPSVMEAKDRQESRAAESTDAPADPSTRTFDQAVLPARSAITPSVPKEPVRKIDTPAGETAAQVAQRDPGRLASDTATTSKTATEESASSVPVTGLPDIPDRFRLPERSRARQSARPGSLVPEIDAAIASLVLDKSPGPTRKSLDEAPGNIRKALNLLEIQPQAGACRRTRTAWMRRAVAKKEIGGNDLLRDIENRAHKRPDSRDSGWTDTDPASWGLNTTTGKIDFAELEEGRYRLSGGGGGGGSSGGGLELKLDALGEAWSAADRKRIREALRHQVDERRDRTAAANYALLNRVAQSGEGWHKIEIGIDCDPVATR